MNSKECANNFGHKKKWSAAAKTTKPAQADCKSTTRIDVGTREPERASVATLLTADMGGENSTRGRGKREVSPLQKPNPKPTKKKKKETRIPIECGE